MREQPSLVGFVCFLAPFADFLPCRFAVRLSSPFRGIRKHPW